tara:strand:+ start:3201 stop:4931 length:1731 start_codon:yes stop_codon:yes gene_type:complete
MVGRMLVDCSNNIQYGTYNHIEYTWSSIQQERILQLSYQLIRTSDENKLAVLATMFKDCFQKGNVDERRLLLKLIAHTRDIEQGKGEYTLSFVLMKELMELDYHLFIEMMKLFVGYRITNSSPCNLSVQNNISYGSWKDIKYYIQHTNYCPDALVTLINTQISQDIVNMNCGQPCSLAAKWVPREGSKKFGWMTILFAKDFYKHYGYYGWSKSAMRKTQTHYRQTISNLNKYIDTIQIKQCGHEWSKIDLNKVTGCTMIKQRRAFLNINSNRYIGYDMKGRDVNQDRIVCREKMIVHIEKVKQCQTQHPLQNNIQYEFKGENIGIHDLVKAALNSKTVEEVAIINELWNNNSNQTKPLDNVIAMIDISSSMEEDNSDTLYAAIGLGIRVAEKSNLGKRIMAFTHTPTWINLDDSPDFVSSVKTITELERGTNADIYKVMDLILNTIIENKIPAEEVENLVFAIFSDMQFDMCEQLPNTTTLRSNFAQKYHDAGVKVCGKGYKVPHILFWNMKNTDGFPDVSYQDGVSMMSGYSPKLLNEFMERNKMYGNENMTPWLRLNNMLNKSRYRIINELIPE